ncbi:MAG: hypothetical protein LAN37_10570 [Acidobacteriia bacterium]|nr:hypothetical protein [Terriglobia bacterium]
MLRVPHPSRAVGETWWDPLRAAPLRIEKEVVRRFSAAVTKALGHSSAQTAMIYQHPGIEAIRQAIDSRNVAQAECHNLRHNPELVN